MGVNLSIFPIYRKTHADNNDEIINGHRHTQGKIHKSTIIELI